MWPGFGENMRVLKWIVERTRGSARGIESPLGWVPRFNDIEWKGLENFTEARFIELMAVDNAEWNRELVSQNELFLMLYDRLPKEFVFMRELLQSTLWRSPKEWHLQAGIERPFDSTMTGGQLSSHIGKK